MHTTQTIVCNTHLRGFKMITKQRLIDSLLELKTQALDNKVQQESVGICLNWADILGNNLTYKLVYIFQQDWFCRTGHPHYPVPNSVNVGLWEGKNLEMRLSLIDYILKRLDEVDQDYIDELIG